MRGERELIALANFSASFFTGSREDGALANFSASFLQVPQRTERSPIFWQPLLQVPQRTERSLIFWQPFLQLPQRRSARQFSGMLGYRSRRGHSDRIFFSEKKHEKGEQHTALSLKRENGHRRRGYVRGNVWFSTALIGRCVFLEIC